VSVDFWKPYVSVAARQRKAAAEAQRLAKKGQALAPVVIEGRAIARTFWGKAWCENLERYSDFATRLPRGRSYARNGSVIDLQIAAGEVTALVSGSELYRVSVRIGAVAAAQWTTLSTDCAGAIDSLVDLLQGKLSAPIMERVTRAGTGLFPTPREIELDCSCPDWADMCKHVAAVLYGVGARLDRQPELLFTLRGVDEKELIASAGHGGSLTASPPSARVLVADGLGELFGIELVSFDSTTAGTGATERVAGRPAPRRSTATRTPASTTTPKAVPRTRPTASSRVTSTAIASANSAAEATSRTATRAMSPSADATPQRKQPRGAPAGARGGATSAGGGTGSTGAAGSARATGRAATGRAATVTGGTVPEAKRRGGATSRSATRPAATATVRKRPTSLSKSR
jgi:uncharacterized Zn finger protein